MEISEGGYTFAVMTRVTIAILTWNSLEHLRQFLPILKANTRGPESRILIIDNASSDGTAEWLGNEHPDLEFTRLTENYGYAGGYARVLDSLSTEYAVLLNSDVEVQPGWLEPMIEFMDRNPAAGALSPAILSYHNRSEYEYAGAAGGWIDQFGFPFCRGRIFNRVEENQGQFNDPARVFWASGACLMVRMKTYREAGGLDPNFFAHMEEIDLCWRIQAIGKEIWYLPQSAVFHVGGGTLPNESPFKLYLNFRNNLLVLYKNLPRKIRSKTLFIRMLFDGIAALQYLAKGKPAYLGSVLKAHADYKKLRTGVYRNWAGPVMESTSGLTGFYRGSIVIDFFLLGRRRFRDLRIHK